MPRALWWSQRGVLFLTCEVPLYMYPKRKRASPTDSIPSRHAGSFELGKGFQVQILVLAFYFVQKLLDSGLSRRTLQGYLNHK